MGQAIVREIFINELLENELKEVCSTCQYIKNCLYRKASTKIIVQCESYEQEKTQMVNTKPTAKGLCETCLGFSSCTLTKNSTVIWRCEEYQY